MDIKLGYQIYSAREDAEKDLGAVCAQLKEMGYDGVEFAGFYGNTAEQVNEILKKTGLAAVSSHVPYQSIVEDMTGTIAFHKAIGCKFIAVPYLDEATRPGAEGFAAAIRNIYKFGQMCKAEGIQLLYHNHDFEFVKLSGLYGLDFLYEAVPADVLATELDTCWVKVAGEDPAAYIQIYNCMGFMMQVEIEAVNKIIHEAKKPVMTIKSMAAGRCSPFVGITFSYNTIRPCDMVTVGAMTADEVHEDVEIAMAALEHRRPDLEGRNSPNRTEILQ